MLTLVKFYIICYHDMLFKCRTLEAPHDLGCQNTLTSVPQPGIVLGYQNDSFQLICDFLNVLLGILAVRLVRSCVSK